MSENSIQFILGNPPRLYDSRQVGELIRRVRGGHLCEECVGEVLEIEGNIFILHIVRFEFELTPFVEPQHRPVVDYGDAKVLALPLFSVAIGKPDEVVEVVLHLGVVSELTGGYAVGELVTGYYHFFSPLE